MRKEVNVNDLLQRKEQILEELHKLPFKERDYSSYRKLTMQIKYNTNKEERVSKNIKSKNRIKNIYDNEEERKIYANYQLSYYHNHKRNIDIPVF